MVDLDHRHMSPPFLRVVNRTPTPRGDEVIEWDLRITQPNVEQLPGDTLHSLEHFLHVELKELSPLITLARPLGCWTGLTVEAINIVAFNEMSELVAAALTAITTATDVPLANEVSCGAAWMHTLAGAQGVARMLLAARDGWSEPLQTPPSV
jgi:S-ribosylhomocysteine lyase